MSEQLISASLVKTLRERTQAGMMACKNALKETGGNLEDAIQLMRKKGDIKAQKKSGCLAADGAVLIAMSDSGDTGVVLEINSQTDFVANDRSFQAFSKEVTALALSSGIEAISSLNQQLMSNGRTIEENRLELISKIGENIHLRRMTLFRSKTGGILGQYVHNNRIAVLVELDTLKINLAKDIAMHVAATKPIVVNPEDVPEDLVEKERDVYAAQAKESGKPNDIIAKMVQGRVNKFLNEASLMGQPFVKDPNQTVSQILKSQEARVIRFIRYEVGDGIEKPKSNFSEEVSKQINESN